jgi:peptide/nickel transport system substrate-binding protein
MISVLSNRRLQVASAFAAAAATAMSAATLAMPSAAADESETTTLTVPYSQEVDSLSPFRAIRLITTMLGRLQYDFLTNYDPDTGETVPGLAEEWEHSDDGLTWTYHLRESSWSDGEAVTADDVAFTFTTMMENEAAAYANGGLVEAFESVTAVDESTVEIKLSEPQSTMEALDIPIAPEHIWSEVDDFEAFNSDDEFPIVSSGPFVVTDYQVNESITLEANPDYWRGAPGFDRIVFRMIPDKESQVEALRSGEVDLVTGLTPAQFEALDGESNIEVSRAQGKRFQAITPNPGAQAQNGDPMGDGHPALQDPVVREALNKTIDRTAIYEGPYGGYGEPNTGLIPSIFPAYHWETDDESALTSDIEGANQMLDEAGYELGDDGIRVDPASGEKLSFRFNVHADNDAYVQMAGMMMEWAAEAGIELRVEPVSEVGALLDAGTYDILTTGWSTNPDPQYILGISLCANLPATGEDSLGLNDAWYCNEQYEALYEQQSGVADQEERAGLVRQMQEILYNDYTFVVLGYEDLLEAYRTDTIESGSIQTQPSDNGIIYGQDGYWSFWSAQPTGSGEGPDQPADGGDGSDQAADSGDESSNTGVVVGVVVAVVLLGGVGAFFLVRRRTGSAEDRE